MKEILFVIVASVLCAFTLPDGKFISKESGFSIAVPKGYRTEKGTDERVPVTLYSPKENKQDNYIENISVVSVAFDGDVDSYCRAALPMMQSMMKDYQLIDSSSKTVNSRRTRWYIYTFTYNEKTVKILAYWFAFKGKAWVITCYSTPQRFDKYRKVFVRVAESLQPE